jgi:mono/diheme cytochrome c family protein
MRHGIPTLLLILGAATPLAHAQQSTGDLNATQLHGRQLLAQACGVCHLPPSLNAQTYGPLLNKGTATGSDEAMRIIITNGTERMPAFKYYLKPSEVDAIIAYVRTVPIERARSANESKGEAQ